MTVFVRLLPGMPVRMPGTNVEVRWEGREAVTVHQWPDGTWDLSALAGAGCVPAYQRLVTRPHLGWWPLHTGRVPHGQIAKGQCTMVR